MQIDIEEGKNHSLYAYKDNELLFYTTFKHQWFKQTISIFDNKDNLVFEIKSKISAFSTSFQIVFQTEYLMKKINEIKKDQIKVDGQNINCNCSKEDIFSLNLNKSYYLNGEIIATAKEKLWSVKKKILVEIKESNCEFLEYIIIHLLLSNTNDQ